MTTFYAYTLTEAYMREAAVASKFPWANGAAVERQMATQYFLHLKAFGPLRLKRALLNNHSGSALVLGKNDTDMESIPEGRKKRTMKIFGCPPHLFTKLPDESGYSAVVTPEQDWIDGKGYEPVLTPLGTLMHNTPLTPEDERI